ncbi:cardiotrophin-1 isoform X2 [Microcaecilia unicolor]|uniref:Cardiotrophin-1 isoform X2 n=1 Tax=Microcaecilia unicolor TaxID=1415580 RepID=A0A6P7YQC0_9AMPH|nr:cardiotrophin-1 isoform X2 [Microcaecilia unicolor]
MAFETPDAGSRPTRLSSAQSKEAAKKIEQISKQVLMLINNSQELLQKYLKYQGSPFGQPDLLPEPKKLTELPSPDLSKDVWLSLSDSERLRQNYVAYTFLTDFLSEVKSWQEDLNPNASDLLELLEKSAKQALGLRSNVASVMKILSFPMPLVPPSPALDASTAFRKKLKGWSVCQQYQDWLHRTQRDITVLMQRYPL